MASSASTNDASRTLTGISDILPVNSTADKAKRIEEFSTKVIRSLNLVKASIKHIHDCEGFPCTSCLKSMVDINTVLQNNNIDQNTVADGVGIGTDYCKMFACTWNKGCMLKKIEDADQQRELSHETTHMVTFYITLLCTGWNFSNMSDYFCLQMEEDGCLSLIVDWFLHLVKSDKALNKWVDDMIINAMRILYNACRRVPSLAPKHHRAVPALQKFGESEESLTQTVAFMTLAKLVKKEDAYTLSTNYRCIVTLLSMLKKCLSNPEHKTKTRRQSSLKNHATVITLNAEELVQSVDDLAINDNNKRLIVEKGGIPLLAKLLQGECFVEEKTSAANGIWRLAFLKENKEKLWKEQGIIYNLTDNSHVKSEKLRHACMGALFEIDEYRLAEGLTRRNTDLESPQRAPSDTSKSSGHIMLSYKLEHTTQPVMREFKKQLHEKGYNVWMDEDHMMGDKIGAMVEAVENAGMIIACITRGYQDSRDCRTEATYAYECKKKIIPVKVSNDFKASGWLGGITAGKIYYIVQQPEHVSEVLSNIIEQEFAVKKETAQNVNAAPEAVKGKEGGLIDGKGCAVFLTTPRDALQIDTTIKGIDDETLDDLAEAIETEQHMEALGRALGFSAAEINRYADTNRKGDRTTTKGTMFMLRDWKQDVGAHNQLQRLTEALKNAGLVMLADTHLMNADPNEALQEKVLVDIAEELRNDENVAKLGRALGFSTAALNRYTETNRRGDRITFKGTRDMLLDWRQKLSPSDQHQKLKEALTEANLEELSDKYLKEVPRSEGIDDETLDDLAGAIETEQHMEALGRALGFSAAEINRYADTNRRGDRTTTKGTMFMLRDWKQDVGAHNQLQRLTEALKEAGLVMLADTHLMNADPNEALQEKVLVEIAEELRNDENVAELGRALGFSTAALNRYTETNKRGDRITFKGTRDMLLDWRQKLSPSDQHQKLKEALTEANLEELSDKYLKEVPEENPNFKEVDEIPTEEFRLPTESLDGKMVGYLAFLPLNMPKSRKPILNLVIYDKVQGFRKGLCEEMKAKGRISQDIERLFFVESSIHNSMEVSCRMDETDEDLRETISLSDVNLGENFLDFTLDFNHLSTNDSNVKVTLTHGKRSCSSILAVDMKGPPSQEQELKTPPVDSQVPGWDSTMVQDWLTANNVTARNTALKTLSGTQLLQLKKQLITAPQSFYQSMRDDLKVPYMDVLSLAAALEKLI